MKTLLLVALMGLVACQDKHDDPVPVPAAPTVVKTHTVELRYWLGSYGDATQLPPTAPHIRLMLWTLSGPLQGYELLLDVNDVSTAVKTVRLPDVTTYAPGPLRVLMATVSVPAVPGTGPGQGYYVQGHYTVDGAYDSKRGVFYDASVADPYDFPTSYTTFYPLPH